MQKSKMAVWGGFQIAVKGREVKSKGEKERYKHLNAEFQTITRDKKAFFSDQCIEIEEKRAYSFHMHLPNFECVAYLFLYLIGLGNLFF